MKNASLAEIEDACMTLAAPDASALLAQRGLHASPYSCTMMIRQLIERGDRSRLTGHHHRAASFGCEGLAAAMNRHFKRVACERGCSVEAAQISVLYSPAQIAAAARPAPPRAKPAPSMIRTTDHGFSLTGNSMAML